MTSFFIGGIIQGSINDVAIHPQDYRTRIKDLLLRWVPGADVYCPIENHPDSLRYEDTHARSVFFGHVDRCGETDVLVAYLPEASMGTAVEMYEAQRKGHIVLADERELGGEVSFYARVRRSRRVRALRRKRGTG